jgi:hypothetical protein
MMEAALELRCRQRRFVAEHQADGWRPVGFFLGDDPAGRDARPVVLPGVEFLVGELAGRDGLPTSDAHPRPGGMETPATVARGQSLNNDSAEKAPPPVIPNPAAAG